MSAALKTIDDMLGNITVTSPDDDTERALGYVVEDEKEELGTFRYEADAFAFRLMLINMRLNAAVAERYRK